MRSLYEASLGPTLSIQTKYQAAIHTVAEKCDCRRCLAVFCDSLTFLRQCGQGLMSTSWNELLRYWRSD